MNVFRASKPFHAGCACPLLLLTAFALLFCQPVRAQEPPQDEVPLAPKQGASGELYRLRVENSEYGSVALSVDGGRRYTLIGRVTRPASSGGVEREARTAGTVLRSGGNGLAFAVSLGQTLKLQPGTAPAASARRGGPAASGSEPAAIITNIAPRTGIFAELTPPAGTTVKLELDERLQRTFPTLYQPSQNDAFVFIVAPPGQEKGEGPREKGNAPPGLPSFQELQERVVALGQAYTAQSIARARQEHRSIVTGTLNLKAKLPEGEPDPIAYVTYAIDSRMVSTQNVAPFTYDWDTRQSGDGEHLVEVRALNRNGHVITQKRALIVVQNKPN